MFYIFPFNNSSVVYSKCCLGSIFPTNFIFSSYNSRSYCSLFSCSICF